MHAYIVRQMHVKALMERLFHADSFDFWDVRGVNICHFVTMDIDGAKPGADGQQKTYVTWAALKNYIAQFIKGKEKPRHIKIIFSMPRNMLADISANAAAAFLNMEYENDEVKFLTAASQKEFSLSKELDALWDEYAKKFFINIGIPVEDET